MSNIMHYKGYRGSVEYSEEDSCLVGQILGIDDILGYLGKDPDEIRTMFHQTVDDYLSACAQQGKTPEKEYKGSFNVRITPEKHRAAAQTADELGISLNQFVSDAIQEKLSRRNCPNSDFTEKVIVAESSSDAYTAMDDTAVIRQAIHILKRHFPIE